MTKLQTRLTTAFATGAVLLNALAPLTFAETLTITGNGAGSDNTVAVTNNSTTTVNQNNVANVTNNVTSNVNTGDNKANFNTGGNVTVDTGNAATATTVTNKLNANQASVSCCGAAQPTSVSLDGNGAFSDNTAALTHSSNISVQQGNTANVTNNVTSKANTGDNQAGFNTGSTAGTGDVAVRTGNAYEQTNVSTTANANVAVVAPAAGVANAGTSLTITGNGAGSDNTIAAYMPSSVVLGQNNNADVTNNVTSKAETGDNSANYNTGRGDVTIDTGSAYVANTVDNMLNFNAADVDCGCVLGGGLTAKIAGNGAAGTMGYLEGFLTRPSNTISATLGGSQVLGQGNGAYLTNNLGGHHNEVATGDNEASMNTAGAFYNDPTVMTGDAAVTNAVSNSANMNILGQLTLPAFQMPQVQTSFDFSALFGIFGLTMH